MMNDAQPVRRVRTRGFTLIEMVVVIAILVILAGMIIAKLDVFEMKANKAVSASTMADVARFVQTYRINTSQYPDGWDTLMKSPADTTPLVAGAPGTTWGCHPEITGGPPFTGTVQQLATVTLNSFHVNSLGRLFITKGYDFVDPTTNTTFQGYQPGGRTFAVGQNLAVLNTADTKAAGIIAKIYPATQVKPANVDLITFGLGPNNTMIGSSSQNALMLEAPYYPNQNQTQYYNRYLCVFEVRNDDVKRPRLVAVLGADGDPIADEIADYYEN